METACSGLTPLRRSLRYPPLVRPVLAILLLSTLLCGCTPEPPPAFDPTAPHQYRVLRGDTWQSISSKREAKPEAIRRWNQLRDDHVLIPGQVLWIYPGGRGAPADVRPAATPEDDALADAEEPPDEAPASQGQPRPRSAVETERVGPGGTALLSMLDDIDSPELKSVPSVKPVANPMEAAMAVRRGGLEGGGEVDGTELEMPAPGIAGPAEIPALPKASPKRCLAAKLDQDVGDYGMAAASGLSKKQIHAGMRPALYALQACLPGGGRGPHELHVEVSLGCDGLVYQTRTVSDAGLPSPVIDCVEKVTSQASFAAAAGATTFLYPIIIGY